MDVPLEIAYHNVEKSDALERRIRARVSRLHERFRHIISCRIVVEAPHRSQVNPLGYHMRVEVRIPEKDLVVSRDPGGQGAHFDAYVLVRDVFDAMERQLEHHAEKMRSDVKQHATPLQGRVLRVFHDHGFVATNDGQEVYFHRNAVIGDRFDEIEPEMTVELSVIEGESAIGPQASTVRMIGSMDFVPDRRGPSA